MRNWLITLLGGTPAAPAGGGGPVPPAPGAPGFIQRLIDTAMRFVRLYIRTFAIAAITAFAFGLKYASAGNTANLETMLLVWLMMPAIFIIVLPVLSFLGVIGSADPQTRTYVEGPVNVIFITWAIGLLYFITLRIGAWHGHKLALLLMLCCLAGSAAVNAGAFGGAAWTKFATKLMLGIALVCGLKAVDMAQVKSIASEMKNKFVPSASFFHNSAVQMGDATNVVVNGDKLAEVKMAERDILNDAQLKVAKKKKDNLKDWNGSIDAALAAGKKVPALPEPIAMATPVMVKAMPESKIPDRVELGGRVYNLTFVPDIAGWYHATYNPYAGLVTHFQWRDGSTTLNMWDEKVGGNGKKLDPEVLTIKWDTEEKLWHCYNRHWGNVTIFAQ